MRIVAFQKYKLAVLARDGKRVKNEPLTYEYEECGGGGANVGYTRI